MTECGDGFLLFENNATNRALLAIGETGCCAGCIGSLNCLFGVSGYILLVTAFAFHPVVVFIMLLRIVIVDVTKSRRNDVFTNRALDGILLGCGESVGIVVCFLGFCTARAFFPVFISIFCPLICVNVI